MNDYSEIAENLREVDELKITSIVDNVADRSFRPATDAQIATRYQFSEDSYNAPLPIAEHGFSILLEIRRGDEKYKMLYDAGLSEAGLAHNIRALSVDLSDLECAVISHGHTDHFAGLPALRNSFGLRKLPVIAHPDVFSERKFKVSEDSQEVILTPMDEQELRDLEFDVQKNTEPMLLLGNTVLLSGEVERDPVRENLIPHHYTKVGDQWELTPSVIDEQSLTINVKGKGLVVLTGCGHAGVVNILEHARKSTGVDQVCALMGGFHLFQQDDITDTLDYLELVAPEYVVPSHCTGWQATHEIAKKVGQSFIQNAVGTIYHFGSN